MPQALAIAETDEEEAVVHEALGDDHEALFHGDDAVREYIAAYGLITDPGDHRVAELTDAPSDFMKRRARVAGKAGRMIMRWGAFHGSAPIDEVQEMVGAALAGPLGDYDRANLLMVNGGLITGENGAPIGAGRFTVTEHMRGSFDERIGRSRTESRSPSGSMTLTSCSWARTCS